MISKESLKKGTKIVRSSTKQVGEVYSDAKFGSSAVTIKVAGIITTVARDRIEFADTEFRPYFAGEKITLKLKHENMDCVVDKWSGSTSEFVDVKIAGGVMSVAKAKVIEIKGNKMPYTTYRVNERIKAWQLGSVLEGIVTGYSGPNDANIEVRFPTGTRKILKSTIQDKEKAKVYPVFWRDDRVTVTVKKKKYNGTVEMASYSTHPTVEVKIKELGVTTVKKTEVKNYVEPKSYFKDRKDSTASEKYMAKLFQAKTHDEVVKLGIKGADLGGYTVVTHPEYFAAIPSNLKAKEKIPCIIAHTDLHPNLTHPTVDNLEYKDGVFKSATGLGADDRAGIYAINQLLKTFPGKFMFLFADKEEVGMLGSLAFVEQLTFKKFDKHASMYVSIDRRRNSDGSKSLATYSYDDHELNKWVSTLTGRNIIKGSGTDCRVLSAASKRGVPCFNLSCGYTNEHLKTEVLYYKELLDTVDDLQDMLSDKRVNRTHKVIPPKTYNNTYNYKRTIKIDGVEYDEDDVKNLFEIYRYFFSEQYEAKKPYVIPEIDEGDFVRLDPTMKVGVTYGGEVFTKDIQANMSDYTWEVDVIDDTTGRLELIPTGVLSTICSKIPRRWVTPITDEEPITILIEDK